MMAGYFSPDIEDFLRILARCRVRYLIVGGEAVIYYGYARLTGDVDIFFEQSAENAERLYGALQEFWEGEVPGIGGAGELLEPGVILQFGVPPNRIDVISRIDAVAFGDAWGNRRHVTVQVQGEDIAVTYIGLDDLIANKQAVNRPKDQEDLKYLRKAREIA
jgi:predicted nucleotidyltransferase